MIDGPEFRSGLLAIVRANWDRQVTPPITAQRIQVRRFVRDRETYDLVAAVNGFLHDIKPDRVRLVDIRQETADVQYVADVTVDPVEGLVDLRMTGLAPGIVSALRSREISRVDQVLHHRSEDLLSIRNFGPASLSELHMVLCDQGYIEGPDEGTS